MKTKLLVMILLLSASGLYAQKNTSKIKWRTTETDTLTIAQPMFDDQNFVMAYP